MNGQSESRPVVGATETAAGNQSIDAQEARNPIISYDRNERNPVLRVLMKGEQNAQKKRDLIALTGLQDRQLRLEIASLRHSGTLICSGLSGYWLPESQQELRAFVRQEQARGRAVFRGVRPAAQALEALEREAAGEQMTIDL